MTCVQYIRSTYTGRPSFPLPLPPPLPPLLLWILALLLTPQILCNHPLPNAQRPAPLPTLSPYLSPFTYALDQCHTPQAPIFPGRVPARFPHLVPL